MWKKLKKDENTNLVNLNTALQILSFHGHFNGPFNAFEKVLEIYSEHKETKIDRLETDAIFISMITSSQFRLFKLFVEVLSRKIEGQGEIIPMPANILDKCNPYHNSIFYPYLIDLYQKNKINIEISRDAIFNILKSGDDCSIIKLLKLKSKDRIEFDCSSYYYYPYPATKTNLYIGKKVTTDRFEKFSMEYRVNRVNSAYFDCRFNWFWDCFVTRKAAINYLLNNPYFKKCISSFLYCLGEKNMHLASSTNRLIVKTILKQLKCDIDDDYCYSVPRPNGSVNQSRIDSSQQFGQPTQAEIETMSHLLYMGKLRF